MSAPRTIQLVAKLPNTLMGGPSLVETHNGNGRPLVISRLKPIFIETPRPSGQNQMVLLDSDDSSDYESIISENSSRKRLRLTNLTNDEKILRRKLKNRVSAQTARDRKKQRMTELEEAIIGLQQQNKLLEAENLALKSRTEALLKENKDLKQQFSNVPTPCKDTSKPTIIVESSLPQVIHVQKKRKLDMAQEQICLTNKEGGHILFKSTTILPKSSVTTNVPSPSPVKVIVSGGNSSNKLSSSPVTNGRMVKDSDKKYNTSNNNNVGKEISPKLSEGVIAIPTTLGVRPCESAALIRFPPLQQELHYLTVAQMVVAAYFLINLTILGVMMSLACKGKCKMSEGISCQSSEETNSSKDPLRKKSSKKLRKWEKKPWTLRKWWGRHQKNWNPSANS